MFNKILVAYDGSDGAKLALAKRRRISKVASIELHLLAVGRIPEYAETVSETRRKTASQNLLFKIMDDAADHLRNRAFTTVHIDFGKPADTILRIAEDLDIDLLVLGTHPHALSGGEF